MAQNDGLSPKQDAFLACLLAGHNAVTAAKMTNIGERTAFRWLKQDSFQAALKDAQRQLFESALSRLSAGLEDALESLQRHISATVEPTAATQIAAAKLWTEQAMQARKLKEANEITQVVGMAIDAEVLPFLDQDDLAEIRRRFDLAAQRQQARKAQ